jgi:uncharacterized protein
MGTLIFAIALALVLGFAAHRASVCTVRAVAEIMSSASDSIFLSIGKSMLWAWALMIPVFARPAPEPAWVGSLLAGKWARIWAGILACAFLAWALYEILRLWRTRARDERIIELILAPRYRLSTAAVMVGLSGALLFLFYGPISYTATFALIIQGALGTQDWPTAMRTVLLLAVMAGMLLSTLQRDTFRVDWRPQFSWLLNLSAGVLMGLGIALAPGGNDALVLDGIPILSPHALPTFTALVVGVALGLVVMRRWFGIEARVRCKNDTFITDTWSRPVSIGKAQ